MCWDRPFARRVANAYKENNLLAFGVVGHVLSLLVFFEMLEKLSGGSGTTWSPLRILGPPLWLPLKNLSGKLMAVQTLIHSAMYFIACYYLVQSRYRKNIILLVPWVAMHCFFMFYQVVLLVENRDEYTLLGTFLAVLEFPVLNIVLVLAAIYTAIQWTPASTPRERSVQGGAETIELQPLHGDTNNSSEYGSGHSAETVVVSDRTWIRPPPPSYDVAVSTPSHATGTSYLALQPDNQGGAINVSWPWRWRIFREAARAAAGRQQVQPTHVSAAAVLQQLQQQQRQQPEAAAAAELQQLSLTEARGSGEQQQSDRAGVNRRAGRPWPWGVLRRAVALAPRQVQQVQPSDSGQEQQVAPRTARRRAAGGVRWFWRSGEEDSTEQQQLQPSGEPQPQAVAARGAGWPWRWGVRP